MKVSKEKGRPGFVVYFDIRQSVELLSKEQTADLFLAMLNYAEYGELPNLDVPTQICFNMMRSRMDYDAEKYNKSIQQKRYAAYVRDAKSMGRDPIPYEDWQTTEAMKAAAIRKLTG